MGNFQTSSPCPTFVKDVLADCARRAHYCMKQSVMSTLNGHRHISPENTYRSQMAIDFEAGLLIDMVQTEAPVH